MGEPIDQNRLTNHAQTVVNMADLAARIVARAAAVPRLIVAIAGPPAAGKSTLTESLREQISLQMSVAVVAQDGYHFDNAVLEKRQLLSVKGAPQTFDVAGFHQLLGRLKGQTQPLAVPVFDRSLDLARGSASIVEPDDRVILVEGNYLLIDEPPWSTLASCFDLRVLLQVPLPVLQDRLVQRWLRYGHTADAALQRARQNDLPNADYVSRHSHAADLLVAYRAEAADENGA